MNGELSKHRRENSTRLFHSWLRGGMESGTKPRAVLTRRRKLLTSSRLVTGSSETSPKRCGHEGVGIRRPQARGSHRSPRPATDHCMLAWESIDPSGL